MSSESLPTMPPEDEHNRKLVSNGHPAEWVNPNKHGVGQNLYLRILRTRRHFRFRAEPQHVLRRARVRRAALYPPKALGAFRCGSSCSGTVRSLSVSSRSFPDIGSAD